METTARLPKPGDIAQVRQRTYLVEQTVPAGAAGDSPLVKLSCVDDDAQGQPLEVLWDHEIDPVVLTGEAWEVIASKGFDPPKLFAAYLNTLRWNSVTSTDAKLFQSPFRAGIRLDAYQLEPLRKALLLPRVNLFIADDVGLGKTIEAGLIARELLLRKKVREITVCCPPSMLLQWRDELQTRFGLGFEILDKAYISRVRRERGFGVNPWGTHTRFIVSHRLLIDEAYTSPLRDHLDEFRPGSLLILDEAHHAAPSSGQKYAIDSQITRAVRDLAPRFEHRLFLSATPHNGHSNSFSALLELLDPQRFCRGVPVKKRMLDDVMVRRLKDDIREIAGGFPRRKVVQIDIRDLPANTPELRLCAMLDEYRQMREERLSGENRRKQAAAGLLITGLQQRLLSSIEAFARTLRVHRRTVQKQWDAAQQSQPETSGFQSDLLFGAVGSDDDRATLSEDELAGEEDTQIEAITAATVLTRADPSAKAAFAREQAMLEQMAQIADTARGLPDARVTKLLEWVRANMCPATGGAKGSSAWSNIRAIIFTEYDDTKRYLHQQLMQAIIGTEHADQRIAIFHGPTPPDVREQIKQAFNADPAKNPVRILIATDAAREGLNLQAHCWNLFHFDVPWNPSRMEQRNGRIDRKLQPSPEVFCHYFFYHQRPEDRVLAALVRKTKTIEKELGSLAKVIEARLTDMMKLGIRRDKLAAIEAEIDAANIGADARQIVAEELEISRQRQNDLRQDIEVLRTQLERSEEVIGFKKTNFQAAISSALELMEAPPLKLVESPDGRTRATFPPLDQLQGSDSWADTMDSLRTPRKPDQKLWEWRRASPIRPVVFEDTGSMDDGVVHLHLEQRVVQRLLARFTAQGFIQHELSRACLAQSADAVYRVIVLGRLCLYGPSAARLHEEIVPITARWIAPNIRKEKLTPYARESESRTMNLLEESLTSRNPRPPAREIQQQLQASAAQDMQELLPHLQARGEEYAKDAEKKLHARGVAEASAMREILETQHKHITAAAAKHDKDDPNQLKLRFKDVEWRQLDANRRHWTKRLNTLERELQTEPDRIKDLYHVRATRIEPVGLVYLWPVTG